LVRTLEQQNLRIVELMDKAAAMNVAILTNQDFIESSIRKGQTTYDDVDMQ
jgi:hypothetical protein